ncbi:MAG: hypothetical protein KC731_21080 [Myxococcales bacterium]|nr:hypothetical protein [Myxococcales bacterium]
MDGRWWWLVMLSTATGCSWFAGLDEFVDAASGGSPSGVEVVEPGGRGEGGAAVGGAGGEPTGGGAGGAGGAGCDEVPFQQPVVADATIFADGCDKAIYFGHLRYVTLGVGRGLFRFALDDALQAAFAEDRVVDLRLVLPRATDCDGPCPAEAGLLRSYPLRNDWVEGANPYVPYSGADWCRRGSGEGGPMWQVPGATGAMDAGAPSGSIAVGTSESAVTLPLSPGPHQSFIDAANGTVELAVLLIAESATFAVASKEEPGGGARLEGSYCTPE